MEKKWTAIVIHHSGTKNGDTAIFDKWHRENNHWEGVGYDFVIGNGSNSGDGQVEVTYRWQKQVTGAHCGGTPGNWANKDGIGICLVGDFNQTAADFFADAVAGEISSLSAKALWNSEKPDLRPRHYAGSRYSNGLSGEEFSDGVAEITG